MKPIESKNSLSGTNTFQQYHHDTSQHAQDFEVTLLTVVKLETTRVNWRPIHQNLGLAISTILRPMMIQCPLMEMKELELKIKELC